MANVFWIPRTHGLSLERESYREEHFAVLMNKLETASKKNDHNRQGIFHHNDASIHLSLAVQAVPQFEKKNGWLKRNLA